MKKKHISTLIVLTALFGGCTSTQDLIEEVAYQYSFAMANYDIDQAEQYADNETRQTTIKTGRGFLTLIDTNYIKSDTPANIEIVNTEIINDSTAIVTYHKTTPIKDFNGTVEVRHKDGKWLVHSPTRVRNEVLPESIEKNLSSSDSTFDSEQNKEMRQFNRPK